MAGRPRTFESPEQMEGVIEDYFNPEAFEETKTRSGTLTKSIGRQLRVNPTITGLAYHLGFESRQSFYDYETIVEYSYIIKKARLRVEMGYEESLRSNNVAGSIFALKNMGWKDRTEVAPVDPDGNALTQPLINIQVVQPKTEED